MRCLDFLPISWVIMTLAARLCMAPLIKEKELRTTERNKDIWFWCKYGKSTFKAEFACTFPMMLVLLTFANVKIKAPENQGISLWNEDLFLKYKINIFGCITQLSVQSEYDLMLYTKCSKTANEYNQLSHYVEIPVSCCGKMHVLWCYYSIRIKHNIW